ncbi:hypothetical protein V7068_11655 [Bacillus sp. JJ634]
MTKRVGIIFKSSEVMNKLNIKDSVFKKYISLLEKEGYVFQKNPQGHRLFFNQDIKALEMFMEMSKYDGVTLEMAAKKISEMNGHDSISKEIQQPHDVMTLMTQLLEEQRITYEKQYKEQEQQFALKMQEVLEQKLEEQERRLLAKINIEEQRQLLKQSLEELQEVKQMIATDRENKPFTFKDWVKTWWK